MGKKRKKLRGLVQKIVKASNEPEKAQIAIHGADELYREIRIENQLTNDKGKETRLRQGEEVEVTLESDTDSNLKLAPSAVN